MDFKPKFGDVHVSYDVAAQPADLDCPTMNNDAIHYCLESNGIFSVISAQQIVNWVFD